MKRSRVSTEKKVIKQSSYDNALTMDIRAKEVTQAREIEQLVAATCKVLGEQIVVNGKGEKLGKIEDIMLDLVHGKIAYAALSFGGFLGLGNKLFAIPWEALCIDNQWNYKDIYRQRVVFNISREKLEKAPGFNKNDWPSEPDRNWLKEVYDYYGCRPYWAPPEEANKPVAPK